MMTQKKADYFIASIEGEAIAMKPYCGVCDIQLNENYYCDKCGRQCKCTHIKCEDDKCYGKVDTLIKKNENFKKFTVEILKGPYKK